MSDQKNAGEVDDMGFQTDRSSRRNRGEGRPAAACGSTVEVTMVRRRPTQKRMNLSVGKLEKQISALERDGWEALAVHWPGRLETRPPKDVRFSDVRLPVFGGAMVPLFGATLADVPSIEVFAHSLACQSRWTGHTAIDGAPVAYSIAQHCYLVADHLPERLKLAGLCHDLPEAIFHDLSRRLRDLFSTFFPEYESAQRNWEALVGEKFGIEAGLFDDPMVREADDRMAATEAAHLGLAHAGVEAEVYGDVELGRCGFEVGVWEPAPSKRMFLRMFEQLAG